ncbi:MAG TPA: sugar ABC transporter permease [Chloroflexota bacterium]|jgi:multiple sugar transport system permease protein|nr:sugar ABC transporter permease [Chloroflexota bacterium]
MAATPARAARRRRFFRSEWPWVLFFLGPNVFLFFVFTAFPVVYGLYISFMHWNVIEPMEFIGLRNYERFFLEDRLTPKVLANTLYFAFGVLPLSIVLPLFFAILLNQGVRLIGLWRGVYYLPMVTSAVAIGVIWKWLYAKQFGLINALLASLGVPKQDWLFNETLVMPAIIVVAIWSSMPLKIIFFLAALQGVPQELYEAASIDGAGRWARFAHVTWPLISPTTFFLVIISIIGLLVGGFDLVWVMTKGGPLDASTLLVVHIFRHAFIYYDMGYASAMAYLLFMAVLILTIVQWRLQKRWVHYN